ncbi:zinc ribbon domain-containing protein [Bacillus massiliglaciei]|uniref:zinc ribbon domain-containing protein n=1 Tax=Bacillus massiliglaciei TaxID=1816693 RepID=UPI000DA5FC60|nr:zinc ribbon domain-containing protein [Bacillus massiliglaciei]
MSELQEKIGSGLNKIQDSLQSNKQKLQNAQTASQYKRIIQEEGAKRHDILLQLGEEVYKKLRRNEIQSEEMSGKVTSLIELDKKLYKAQQAVAELQAQSDARFSCGSCGAPITPDDKFCGGCGSKVELPKQEETTEQTACPACEEKISVNAAYCSCCGSKM